MFNFSSEKVNFTLPKALVQLFVHILTIKKLYLPTYIFHET